MFYHQQTVDTERDRVFSPQLNIDFFCHIPRSAIINYYYTNRRLAFCSLRLSTRIYSFECELLNISQKVTYNYCGNARARWRLTARQKHRCMALELNHLFFSSSLYAMKAPFRVSIQSTFFPSTFPILFRCMQNMLGKKP